jgi:hypothetical protein
MIDADQNQLEEQPQIPNPTPPPGVFCGYFASFKHGQALPTSIYRMPGSKQLLRLNWKKYHVIK